MFLISRPPPPKRTPQAMSIQSIHSDGHPPIQEHQHHSPARRQYIRPALRIDCPPPPTPNHWDLASRVSNLDVREEDGYVLCANGEESTSGVFVPCEPLSAVSRARPGPRRLRIKPMVLHRRRISGITTSPISPTSVYSSSSGAFLLRDCLPPTPLTPNTDFKNLYNSLRKCDDALPAAKKTASHELPLPLPPAFPISPPISPAASGSPSSPRQQRPVLHVQTSSPVGTSAPPPTPALTSPSPSTFQFRPSGRLPKRSPIPVWPTEYYPRAVVA